MTSELFKEEQGMLVGDIVYEGSNSTNGCVRRGYKVLLKNGKFMGLLDENRVALWWIDETSLKRI